MSIFSSEESATDVDPDSENDNRLSSPHKVGRLDRYKRKLKRYLNVNVCLLLLEIGSFIGKLSRKSRTTSVLLIYSYYAMQLFVWNVSF